MVAMNPPLGNSKPPNFGKPMDMFTSLSSRVLCWIQKKGKFIWKFNNKVNHSQRCGENIKIINDG